MLTHALVCRLSIEGERGEFPVRRLLSPPIGKVDSRDNSENVLGTEVHFGRIERAHPTDRRCRDGEKTIRLLEEGIDERSGDATETSIDIGIAAAAASDFKRSLEALQAASIGGTASLQPVAQYHFGRVLYESRGDLDLAVHNLRQAVQADPGNFRAQLYLRRAIAALVRKNLASEAEEHFRTYLEVELPWDIARKCFPAWRSCLSNTRRRKTRLPRSHRVPD